MDKTIELLDDMINQYPSDLSRMMFLCHTSQFENLKEYKGIPVRKHELCEEENIYLMNDLGEDLDKHLYFDEPESI